jgi:hypothetical protein
MAKDPAFLLYYKDVLVSCADWDADAFGWYLKLLFHQADKPEGLVDDLESRATMAGVKFSQFERFKLCWERTLKAQFVATPEGLLINKRQAEVLSDRREYTKNQAIRGTVGAFSKKYRSQYKHIDAETWKSAMKYMIENFSLEDHDTGGDDYSRALLQAYANSIIVNADANGNADEFRIEFKEGVQGEKVSHTVTVEVPRGTVSQSEMTDEWFSSIFDEKYMEGLIFPYRGIDLRAELEKFKVKVRGDPNEYGKRDTGGIRNAFLFQLNQVRPGGAPKTISADRMQQFKNMKA